MGDPVRRIAVPATGQGRDAFLQNREWLVGNGLGGYASGTLSGVVTRRYHGMLVSAEAAPLGRMVMLNHLSERVTLPSGRSMIIGGEMPDGPGAEALEDFRLDIGLPVWRFAREGVVIEKMVFLAHMRNTAYVVYRVIEAPGAVRLTLRPSIDFRHQHDAVHESSHRSYTLSATDGRFEISAGPSLPVLRLSVDDPSAVLTVERGSRREVFYRVEAERGYESHGSLWSPGRFSLDVKPGAAATLIASTESWHNVEALPMADALAHERDRRRRLLHMALPDPHDDMAAGLVLAADAFVVSPAGRIADATRARAAGDEVRTVIAGYHWFTDWGRDTMIGLEGLTLATRRHTEAGWILRAFAPHIRDGLIPNMFPEGRNEACYNTADATLWYFHALDRYLAATGDRPTLALILPKLEDIVAHHLRGTRYGIGIDPSDGLLTQGADGYQLTWMDAKVGGWVVTPRRGKAVELNALWYNALCLMERWLRDDGREEDARSMAAEAERARISFNRRFWNADGGCLYDVVDGDGGDDSACRPNQLFAISLPHPVLDRDRWDGVMQVVTAKLLTPVGLRTLSSDHPDYKPKYFGDLRARDASYHQGTVWPWLMGPYLDAWLTLHPDDKAGARRLLQGFIAQMECAGVGSLSEIHDAEPPFTPRGCIAQAWSVAEVLRCWLKSG